MSRPRIAEANKRIHPVTFWLNDDEYAHLQAAAQRSGLRVNELARRLTRRGQHRLVIQTTRRHDPAYIAQIRALGNNLNQIAMRANLTGRVSSKLENLCEEIRRIVLAAVDEAGI
jgi:hypothetical protein